MERFGQHTKLVATRGNADQLVSKFLESVEIQRKNPACELMIVSRSPENDDVVFLTEVWSSESEWEAAGVAPRSPNGPSTCRRSLLSLPSQFD